MKTCVISWYFTSILDTGHFYSAILLHMFACFSCINRWLIKNVAHNNKMNLFCQNISDKAE